MSRLTGFCAARNWVPRAGSPSGERSYTTHAIARERRHVGRTVTQFSAHTPLLLEGALVRGTL